MAKEIDVLTGEVAVGDKKTILHVRAIGSCVVVSAYCRKKKIGGLAHVMLPGEAMDSSAPDRTKYTKNALEQMFSEISDLGVDLESLEICMIGGANVLKNPDENIGESNIKSINEFLRQHGMDVQAQSVGGTERRSVCLDIKKGTVFYTVGDGGKELLWPVSQDDEE